MRKSLAMSAAAVAVAAGLAAAVPQVRSGGSQVPCAVPLAWRLARVDAEFGLSADEATALLRQAAAMWEEQAGRSLFRYDSDTGFPIRLVYDERQARSDERAQREAELAREQARLDAEGEALRQRGDRHAAARARYAERQRAYDQRVEDYNSEVRAWNERGGGSDGEAERLDAVGEELRDERSALDEMRRALEQELAGLQDSVDRINRANAEHANRTDQLAREFPSATMEAGEYREAVRMEGRRIASVGREIRVYRFGNPDELRLIVAHELGHALGLGHLEEPRAIMSAAHDARAEGRIATEVHRADLEHLRSTCPALFGNGR